MLNPKYQRYANRLQELIEEGMSVARLEKPSSVGPYIQDEDATHLYAWVVKISNILAVVFGPSSPHVKHFKEIIDNYIRTVSHSYQVQHIVGVLQAALDDLQKGYLLGQEFLVAGEVFDSVLEQARHLKDKGFKDHAAILTRVVLEEALRRLSRELGIDSTLTAARLNDELRKSSRINQPQWRLIQSWLDVGNAAAHGNFANYTENDVARLIEGIEQFLANEFHK